MTESTLFVQPWCLVCTEICTKVNTRVMLQGLSAPFWDPGPRHLGLLFVVFSGDPSASKWAAGRGAFWSPNGAKVSHYLLVWSVLGISFQVKKRSHNYRRNTNTATPKQPFSRRQKCASGLILGPFRVRFGWPWSRSCACPVGYP